MLNVVNSHFPDGTPKTTVFEKKIESLKMTYLFDFIVIEAQIIRFAKKR